MTQFERLNRDHRDADLGSVFYDSLLSAVVELVGSLSVALLVWYGGGQGEDTRLANCYRNSLTLAVEHGIKSIAFPGISTGAYGFPPERAARIAVVTVQKFLETHARPEKVIFVCFDREAREVYRALVGDAK